MAALPLPNKNQLRWRCRRGMQELDILLLRFLDEHFDSAGTEQQQAFVELLQLQDDVLWDWLSGQQQPADETLQLIVAQMR